MKREHHMEYEAWWQGADGNWRLAAVRKRTDSLMSYLREFIERYPGVPIVAYKKWTIRHAVFEMRDTNKQPNYPQVTLQTQLEIYGKRDAEENSPVPVQSEPTNGPGDGGGSEGRTPVLDTPVPCETGRGDVDSQEPTGPQHERTV